MPKTAQNTNARTGKECKTLKQIQYYPEPHEILEKLTTRQGLTYKNNLDFYAKRDRPLAAFYILALRISEAIHIHKSQFVYKTTYVLIQAVKLSKSRVKGKPRRIEYRGVQLPLSGPRESLSWVVLDYECLLKDEERLFPFSLEKNERDQIVGCKRAWQIVHSLLLEFTEHWLRAFGESYRTENGITTCWL